MALPFLRDGLPAAYPFSVTQQPHRAKLDQNETPIDLPMELKRELAEELAARPWNRYIQPAEYESAKRGLARCFSIEPDELAITVGADQAIEAAFLIAGGPGRSARWFEPTYPFFAHAAMRSFTEQAASTADADIVAFASPNNPTGELVPDEKVEAALAEPSRLVIMDEAYADFSKRTWIGRHYDHPNLFIIRSLSKSSLAAVHLGFVVAHPDVIATVERMYTAPYQLNHIQLLLARRYDRLKLHVAQAAAEVIDERERITRALQQIPCITPRPSAANFILFKVGPGPDAAGELYKRLTDAGVRIRDVSGLKNLGGHLRVTLGTPEENELFLRVLADA